ncbi:MAG: O-methyltransferase [Abditibacteriaceae bacterium]
MSKFTPLNEELYEYIVAQRSNSNDPVLDNLRTETEKLGDLKSMQIGADQGAFFTILVAALGVKNALEIGTFTGFSSTCIARGLPDDGKLICLDQSEEWTNIARRVWKEAGVDSKIELRVGDAHENVKNVEGPLDFVFLDADKTGYEHYYETILSHVRPNGVIIFDNMLRDGRVINPDPENENDAAVVALNQKLANDKRIQCALVPIADGLQVCRKL